MVELAPGSDRSVLLWRLPSEESYSDWKIEIHSIPSSCEDVTTEDEGRIQRDEACSPTIYYVHRGILAGGPRHSQYFKQLFLSNTLETTNQISVIELEQTAADVFPAMLDFMYESSKDVVVENPIEATALRHLANYFGIRELFENVNTMFIKSNLSSETAFVYMEEATKYHEIALRNAAIDYVAERVLRIDHTKLYRMPVEWFSRLMANVAVNDRNIALIVGYAKQEPEGLNIGHISEWMERFKSIPSCHSLALLSIAVDFNVDREIKDKCVSSYAEKWQELAQLTGNLSLNKEDKHMYEVLPDNEKLSLLEASLRKAEVDYNVLKQKLDRKSARSAFAEAYGVA